MRGSTIPPSGVHERRHHRPRSPQRPELQQIRVSERQSLNGTDPTGHAGDDSKIIKQKIDPFGGETVIVTADRFQALLEAVLGFAHQDLVNALGRNNGSNGGEGGDDGGIETVIVTGHKPPPTLIGPVANPGSGDQNDGLCHLASSLARSIINVIPKRSGINTGSVSLVGTGTALGFSGQLSGGIAIDGQGDIALTFTVGGSTTGGGGGFSGGVNASLSNAASVNSLCGGFANQSLTVGDGLSGGVDAFEGVDMNGQQVRGGGVTAGVGAGLSLSGGATFTEVKTLCDG